MSGLSLWKRCDLKLLLDFVLTLNTDQALRLLLSSPRHFHGDLILGHAIKNMNMITRSIPREKVLDCEMFSV